MPFIDTVHPANAKGDVLAMYERQQAALGFVPNYSKVFCHRPEIMERWARLLAAIRRPMDARRFELITFAAARALRNSYCSLAHGKVLTAFFGIDGVLSIADSGSEESLTDAECAMMSFARKVAVDASSVTPDDIDMLKSHAFSDEEIFDIAATAAARAFFTKILDALGAEADDSFSEMDDDLRRSLTVGRPIENPELHPAE